MSNSRSDIGADGITAINVRGYKSLVAEQSIQVRPLTILAGANSSGKSSIMQPLLLLKQTLEAGYDPGALLLDGANLRFTSTDQLFFHHGSNEGAESFTIGFTVGQLHSLTTCFKRHPKTGIDVAETTYSSNDKKIAISRNITQKDIKKIISKTFVVPDYYKLVVSRSRCFLNLAAQSTDGATLLLPSDLIFLGMQSSPRHNIDMVQHINEIIHIPGLRGNPARTYPVTAVETSFPGTFEKYTASVIAKWQVEGDHSPLNDLCNDLKNLGLTWKVSAKAINDTQVELQVGRLSKPLRGGARDLVSIADVG